MEFASQLLAKVAHEDARVTGQVQRVVIMVAPLCKVLRQVLIRVPVPVGALDPDLSGADTVSQRLCCKLGEGVNQVRTTIVLASCFCIGQTVL